MPKRMGLLFALACWLACPLFPRQLLARQAHTAPAQVTAIKFGTLITEDGESQVLKDAVVLVEGDRIRSVGAGLAIPAGAKVIDLSGYTGMPGMIDMHTHITYAWRGIPGTNPMQQMNAMLPQELVFHAEKNARRCLEIGVTTVRDLMARNYNDIALRNLINEGYVEGPRMFVAGPALMITSAAPRYDQVFPWILPSEGQVDGVAEIMKKIRQEVAAGVDVIKMFGSTGGFNNVVTHQTFTYEEMAAAVETAHTLGKRIAVHSYQASGARDAARAGADTIEHAAGVDDATFQMMVQKDITYDPTVYHNDWYAENYKLFGWGQKDIDALHDYTAQVMATITRAHSDHVRISMGSDAIFDLFGKQTNELAYLVKAGLTPAEAVDAATKNGAYALGMSDTLGAVAPDHFADIVAVQGDPLSNIDAAVHGVRWVMKGGKVVVDRIQ
ncbi:MAG TPA: amidohydrolase family protein [Candidatus Acidoferrales bacterium]|nr:amidohydrolase family protein [Candidatus Acidoferrales bacterium]